MTAEKAEKGKIEEGAASGRGVLRRLWGCMSTRLCLVAVAAYCAVALYGEASYRISRAMDVTPSYNAVDDAHRNVSPVRSWGAAIRRMCGTAGAEDAAMPFRPLGTDNLGRDVAKRCVQGARIAFHVGIMTSLIAIPLGVMLGCAGGYFGGRVDSAVVWLCATVASMPGLLFILAISLVAGKGLMGIYLGIGLTTWVGVCRTIRAETMKHRDRAYVQAARVLGYSHMRIICRHILPNVAHLILIQFSIRFPSAVSTEVFISFIGIGVQDEPSWGNMIKNACGRLWQGVWWELASVTAAIFVLVLAFNRLADALRDCFDPALRTGRGA